MQNAVRLAVLFGSTTCSGGGDVLARGLASCRTDIGPGNLHVTNPCDCPKGIAQLAVSVLLGKLSTRMVDMQGAWGCTA